MHLVKESTEGFSHALYVALMQYLFKTLLLCSSVWYDRKTELDSLDFSFDVFLSRCCLQIPYTFKLFFL